MIAEHLLELQYRAQEAWIAGQMVTYKYLVELINAIIRNC